MKINKFVLLLSIILGLIITFIGILFFLMSFRLGGGFGWEILPAIILMPFGLILIFSFLFLYNMKRNNAILFSIISAIIVILILFLVIQNCNNQYIQSINTPYVSCEVDSFNDSANMIKWVVIQTYEGIINNEYLGYRLVNASSGSNEIDANISYFDIDESNTLTNGDIFEVFAPSDGIYNFQIIDYYTGSLACEYSKSY